MERFERAVVEGDRGVGLKNENLCSRESRALGHVRGLSSHYANGIERMEIHVMKKAAHALPYKNERVRITLVIRGEPYSAGLRSTERNKVRLDLSGFDHRRDAKTARGHPQQCWAQEK